MNCMSCKNGEMKETKTAYFAQIRNNCYVIIEGVPCLKCDQCGEEFFTASVAEKIDEIIEKVEQISSKISVVEYEVA